MSIEKLDAMVQEAIATLSTITVAADLEQAKAKWLGKTGEISLLMKSLGTLSAEERPAAGARINVAKQKIEEALKQQVVKIVQSLKKPEVVQPKPTGTIKENTPKPVQKAVSIKRMGALSALGSLKASNQKAGLNLGAAQTTAGPGLGGTEGSGGVQTSLYGKGLTAAPLGAGANRYAGPRRWSGRSAVEGAGGADQRVACPG